MSVKDFVKKLKIHSDKEQYKLMKNVDAVQNAYDESETKKEANEKAKNIVIDIIQKHQDMPVGEFLRLIQENTDLSDNSLIEIIKQMPDIKSEKATVEAVKKVDLASEAITEIIQDAPVSPITAQKLAEQIPDEDIQREQQAEIEKWIEEEERIQSIEEEKELVSRLDDIYDICAEINDNELVKMISELNIETKTDKISRKLEMIIAKKIAVDCMTFGGPKIPTMVQVMPTIEMLDADLPNLAEKEYYKNKSLFDDDNKKYYAYNNNMKKLVKAKLIENIAKDVAKNFDDIGDISVPQSEALKSLNKEELDVFISTVKKYCREEEIKDDDIEIIKRQLKGDTVEELTNLTRMLEKMKPREREKMVRNFMQILKINEGKTQEQKEVDNVILEIGENIRKLPVEKQLNTGKAIVNVLEQQQKKINEERKNRLKESDEER